MTQLYLVYGYVSALWYAEADDKAKLKLTAGTGAGRNGRRPAGTKLRREGGEAVATAGHLTIVLFCAVLYYTAG
jgi:hypothetical protein